VLCGESGHQASHSNGCSLAAGAPRCPDRLCATDAPLPVTHPRCLLPTPSLDHATDAPLPAAPPSLPQAHDDRNLARQLTTAERSEKKLRKLLDDSGVDSLVCVYWVGHLDLPQHRWV
jgi:hypothetical protein